MDFTKRLNFGNIFLFLFLILFPFGQIIRIGILQPIDVVVGLGALYSVVVGFEKPRIFSYFQNFLLFAGFSWVFSIFYFKQTEVLYGLLYLIRLFAYFYFFIYVWNFVRRNQSNRKLLVDSLLAVSVFSAAFGWIQYFNFPALRSFMVWGWDEHLFRLVGTFLDPTFLGLIIVFGLLTTIIRIMVVKRKWLYLFIAGFLLMSLAFTYSRASYLAFLAGITFIFFFYRKFKYFLIFIFSFLILVFLLPTSGNTILRFTREFSALARIENYTETVSIFKTSPVFGVGYDNLCLAKVATAGYLNFASHSCSGSDSSLLLVLATTGVAGFIVFIYSLWSVGRSLVRSSYFLVFSSSFLALLVHSLFSNSMFYPWVMGIFAILAAASLGVEG